MPRLGKGEVTNYVTPYGKKVVSMVVTAEFEKKLAERAASKSLTRTAYIVTLINKDLEEAAESGGTKNKSEV